MTRRSKSAARRPGGHRWTWPVVALLAVLLLPAAAHAADPVIAVAGDIACDPKNHNFNSGNGSSDNCRQKHVSDLLLDSSGAPTVNAVLPTGDNQYYCGGPGFLEPVVRAQLGADADPRHHLPGRRATTST